MRGCGLLLVAFLLAGCGGKSNDGGLGGHCYPNGTCDVGLACSGGVCAVGVDAAIDSPPDAFVCNDDTVIEPNETPQTAYDTNVATLAASRTITGLAICPIGDKDHYKITTSLANQNIEVLVDFAPGVAALQASILNPGGVAISNSLPVAGMTQRVRSYSPSVPAGTYYALVTGPSNGTNNYQLGINVTGP